MLICCGFMTLSWVGKTPAKIWGFLPDLYARRAELNKALLDHHSAGGQVRFGRLDFHDHDDDDFCRQRWGV